MENHLYRFMLCYSGSYPRVQTSIFDKEKDHPHGVEVDSFDTLEEAENAELAFLAEAENAAHNFIK